MGRRELRAHPSLDRFPLGDRQHSHPYESPGALVVFSHRVRVLVQNLHKLLSLASYALIGDENAGWTGFIAGHSLSLAGKRTDTINSMEEHEVYSVIGHEGFERLVAAFYRQVPGDEVLGPMYPADDLQGSQQRLRDFLIYRFGGPPTYIQQRGHPRLRMRHAHFSIGPQARDRWVQLMNHALEQAMLPDEVQPVLRKFFASTALFLMNRGTES
jgi:hemoglobin